MWASVENWAYPQWTSPLFISHPNLAVGFSPDFFMQAAGAVEFGLSFALVWTPLCRPTGALILAGMFLSAVLEFGKIDAIGHSCIVALVLAIAADDRVESVRLREVVWPPVGYAAALTVFLMGTLRAPNRAVRHKADLTAATSETTSDIAGPQCPSHATCAPLNGTWRAKSQG